MDGFPIPKIITVHKIKIVATKNKGTINILMLSSSFSSSSSFIFNNNIGYQIYYKII